MEARFRRAARHSRRVRLLRKAIPAVVALALLLIAGASIFNPFRLLAKLPINMDNLTVSGTKITMASPHLTGFTPDQRPYELRARTATQDVTDPVHVELHDLTSKVQMEDKSTVTMDALSGLFDTKTQVLELKDKIFLQTSTGYEARLSQATVDMASGSVTSNQPVAVKLLNGTLDANGLHITEGGALVVFEGGVSMLLNMDNNGAPAGAAAAATNGK
ncbi:MAG: LPS export ABC transporter periplasmic protein LptC [Xanthobacteraceae bacterium]|nr:LPS export ABC transporter periplasmic protein LptC [Xanthobacteraceae bacterium]